jgi:hypothetical protein
VGLLVRVLILASTLVISDHRGMMLTVLAMIDASAKIIGGPLMASLYSFGMDVRGRSAALCFLTAAVSHRPRIFTRILNNCTGLVRCRIPPILWY